MNCSATSLMEVAKCFHCIPRAQSDAMAIYLLCSWANHLTPAEQFAYTPETEQVFWFDTGPHTGDLATFRATADIPNVTVIDFTHELITTVTGLSALPSLTTFLGSDLWSVTTLDFTGCNNINSILVDLGGSLTSLIVAGCASLVTLNCPLNQITELDVTGCTSLQILDCNTCALLTTITGLATCSALVNFQCFSCDITGTLNVSGLANLTTLNCSNNPLTSLNLTGASIAFVSANNLTAASPFTLTGGAVAALDFTNSAFTSFDGSTITSASSNITFSMCGSMTSLDLSSLLTVTGSVFLDDTTNLTTVDFTLFQSCDSFVVTNSAVTSISFPELTTIGSNIIINACASITAFSAPVLDNVTDFLNFGDCPSLLSLSFPSLIDQLDGDIILTNDTSLTTFSLAVVTATINGIDATNCPSLTTLFFNTCSVDTTIVFAGCASIVSMTNAEFPNTFNSNGNQDYSGCTSLSNFTAATWTPSNGTTCSWNGDALNSASIDNILSRAVAVGMNAGTLDLSGGTNLSHASWSVAALADETTLTTAGVTVLSNP